MDELGVVGERANQRMFVHERELSLRRSLPSDQRAQGLQPIRAVGVGRGAGLFELIAGMTLGYRSTHSHQLRPLLAGAMGRDGLLKEG